jgi:hypothetical protein
MEGCSMKRRGLMKTAGLAMALPMLGGLSGCLYEQFFDIGWDEEVKLHDGRVIVVKVKYTYERPYQLDEYETARLRKTQVTWDTGGAEGVMTLDFKGHVVPMIDKLYGIWILLLAVRYGGGEIDASWGGMQDESGHKSLKLHNGNFEPFRMEDIPKELRRANLLTDGIPIEQFVKFNGGKVSLSLKEPLNNEYVDLVVYHRQIWHQTPPLPPLILSNSDN